MYSYILIYAFTLPDGGTRYREIGFAADSLLDILKHETEIPGRRLVGSVKKRHQVLARR